MHQDVGPAVSFLFLVSNQERVIQCHLGREPKCRV